MTTNPNEAFDLAKALIEGAGLIDEIPLIIGPAISDYMRQAAALLDRRATDEVWQPIETAPKDGAEILLGWKGMALSGYWSKFANHLGWSTSRGMYANETAPTHWMPLPSLPSNEPRSAAPTTDDGEAVGVPRFMLEHIACILQTTIHGGTEAAVRDLLAKPRSAAPDGVPES